jgi:hypothetical protein
MAASVTIAPADSFLAEQVISHLTADGYSTSEEATPIVPGDTNGATSQITVNGIGKAKALLADQADLTLTTDRGGVAKGTVVASDYDFASGVLGLTADSLINRLNADVQAPSYFDIPLVDAWVSYNALVGVTSGQTEIDGEIAFDNVVFPGFVGNLWDNLKQMCAARNYQIYSTGDKIGITKPGKIKLTVKEPATSKLSVDRTNRAQTIEITNYNLSSTTNGIFFKATEVFSLDAGEEQVTNQTVNGTPNTINNPVPVGQMNLAYTTGVGQYTVTGSDGYVISPQWWVDNGGSITVAKSTEQADEVVITMKAPADASRAPYKISEGEDRPALWITGTGVLKQPETITLYTGDPTAPQKVVEVDNIFIANRTMAYDRGTLASQMYGGPAVGLSMTGVPDLTLTRIADGTAITTWFGSLAGSILDYEESRYRVTKADFKPGGVDLTLVRYVTIADFNTVWSGKTIAQFNAAIAPGVTFGQLSVYPLTASLL